MQKKKKSEIICRCNNVSRATIETAITNGCETLNQIFDDTQAGVGACGGSCRRKLKPLLDFYLANGTFPEKIIEDRTGKFPAPAPGSATAIALEAEKAPVTSAAKDATPDADSNGQTLPSRIPGAVHKKTSEEI